jgi:hypothetical protein
MVGEPIQSGGGGGAHGPGEPGRSRGVATFKSWQATSDALGVTPLSQRTLDHARPDVVARDGRIAGPQLSAASFGAVGV